MSQTSDIKFSEIAQAGGAKLLNKTKGDRVIWAVVLLLVLISLLAVYSATGTLAYKMYRGNTEVYLFKQIAFIAIGFCVIYFAHRVNYTIYSRVAKILFFLSIPLLLYTLFFGVTLNEGSRWIRLPIINLTMQTSDLAKLSLFMFLARLSFTLWHVKGGLPDQKVAQGLKSGSTISISGNLELGANYYIGNPSNAGGQNFVAAFIA